jgi:hypothetical protein
MARSEQSGDFNAFGLSIDPREAAAQNTRQRELDIACAIPPAI